MASDGSTPQAVLDAPTSTPVVVSAQPGQNRAGRRHTLLDAMGHPLNIRATYTIPKAARQPASNEPYVNPLRSSRLSGKRAARRARYTLT